MSAALRFAAGLAAAIAIPLALLILAYALCGLAA